MATLTDKDLSRLDDKDQEKIDYFFRLILKKSKYKQLRTEIKNRRKEIKSGESLSHEQLWQNVDV